MGYRNNVFFGLALGIIVPLIAYVFWNSLFNVLDNASIISSDGFSTSWRERTVALLSICMNIIPFQVYLKRRCEQTMRGLIFPTVILVCVWIYFFKDAIFG